MHTPHPSSMHTTHTSIKPTHIELVSLHNLGRRVVMVIMGLVVLVPLVALVGG